MKFVALKGSVAFILDHTSYFLTPHISSNYCFLQLSICLLHFLSPSPLFCLRCSLCHIHFLKHYFLRPSQILSILFKNPFHRPQQNLIFLILILYIIVKFEISCVLSIPLHYKLSVTLDAHF